MENYTNADRFVFWDGSGKIVPHLLYEFFTIKGIYNHFPEEHKKKNSDPVMVRTIGNFVSPVNVGYLLELAKNHILECTSETGESGPILDSLHKSIALFSDKNLKLLKTLKLNLISDTHEYGYFFFKNGVLQVSENGSALKPYSDFDDYVFESSIIQLDFKPIATDALHKVSDFMRFLLDLTVVEEPGRAAKRFNSLASAIGYLLHRFKNPVTTKAIILMDIYVDGLPNGGSGKTLLINSIGKLRNLSIVDGKKYDQREWFALSSVDIESEVLLFDDAVKNFDFELIFPIMTTGLQIRLKYKNHVYIPFEKAPKVAITTNYAINGDSASHRRRKFEFEISPTYNASYSPRDKFGRNFFSEWDEDEWNRFYNTMFLCLQVFLKYGLIESEPINLSLTKLINKTSEDFVEWAENAIAIAVQYDKKQLYDSFVKAYPEYFNKLKQREFTFWLRSWGDYLKLEIIESHSGDVRYIQFSILPTV
jgi:hypothetical protein